MLTASYGGVIGFGERRWSTALLAGLVLATTAPIKGA
jgi:hypothetical protein